MHSDGTVRRRRWITISAAAAFLGSVAGFLISLWLLSPIPQQFGAPLTESFDFRQATDQIGSEMWEVVQDKHEQIENWYLLGPWKGESTGFHRHIAAECELKAEAQQRYLPRLKQVLQTHIERSGGRINGPRRETEKVGGTTWPGTASSLLYSLGGLRGAVHLTLVPSADKVTLIVTITEVRATAESWPLGDIPLFNRDSGEPWSD